MFDFGFEGEREEKRKTDKWVCERIREKKIKPNLSWFKSFILIFTDGIIDKILNIIIFNIFIDDSVCKFKLVKRNNSYGL